MPTLKELAVDHPYYCHTNNYYSNNAHQRYVTWVVFAEEYMDADIDMNLCFRWDIKEITDGNTEEPTGRYKMEVFIIGQRKGLFKPIEIDKITEEDVPSILEYLNKHYTRLQENWAPMSAL